MIDKSPRPKSRSSAKGISVTASGGKNPGANLKPSPRPMPAGLKPSPRPMPAGLAAHGTPHPVRAPASRTETALAASAGNVFNLMGGSKDKAPPRRTPEAEIKGYLSKVAREDRETEKSNYKTLDRAMGGAAKRERMDAEEGRKNKGKKFKNGGCVMAGRGGKYKGMK